MGFAGQYLDPTGLYHLRARQYDPTSGRFLTTDPVAAAVGDPYVASYVYGRSSPINNADQHGECLPFCLLAANVAAPEVLGAAAAAVGVTVAVGGAIIGGIWVGHELAKQHQQSYKWVPQVDPKITRAQIELNRRYTADENGINNGGGGWLCQRHPKACKVGAVGVGATLLWWLLHPGSVDAATRDPYDVAAKPNVRK